MSLTVPTRIGAYDVIAKLGEGGMGAVYRARDTKLNREVALKVLLPAVANDAERLARFRREAQVLASLNHPHIGGIHGLEESDGTIALVMELVEGEDLSQRIAHGAIPLEEALPIARQIAEALEAAHEQGIVHRDLKPANIKVRPDGTVKVLDFGLAKAIGPSEGDGFSRRQAEAEASALQTITSPAMTQAGMILGTAAYMSPEQASGKPVDKRTDLWAFGVVLLEMLTGRGVFAGDTVTHVLAAVLKDQPDFSTLPPETPRPIRTLLRRCLQKDPRKRLADAADARLEIDEAMHDPADAVGGAPVRQRTTPFAWLAIATLALAAGAAGALAWTRANGAGAGAPLETRVEIGAPPSSRPESIALSPDGRQIAFAATTDDGPALWVRPLSSTTARRLRGTDGASLPFWSPDGSSLGFFAARSLKRLDLQSEDVVVLAYAPTPGGAAWHPDGSILFTPTRVGGVVRLPSNGGEPAPVTVLQRPDQTGHHLLDLFPDGRHFLYRVTGAEATRGVWIGSLDGAAPRRLVDADLARVATPRTLVFVRQGALFAQALAPDLQSVTGEPASIVRLDGAVIRGMSVVGHTLIYRPSPAGDGEVVDGPLEWRDRAGRAVAAPASAGATGLRGRNPALSPDGRQVAVDRSVNGNADIWTMDVARGVPTRFTSHVGPDRFATWTADGRHLVFYSRGAVYRRSRLTAGADELLFTPESTVHPLDISPGGTRLLYEQLNASNGWDLLVLPLPPPGVAEASGRAPAPQPEPVAVSGSVVSNRRGAFSPDGRWVLYESDESGQNEIYLQPFPGPGQRIRVSAAGGVQPRWRGDGRELYFVALDRRLLATSVRLGPDGQSADVGVPAPLFRTALGDLQFIPTTFDYAVTRDGQRFLMYAEPMVTTPLGVILNWR